MDKNSVTELERERNKRKKRRQVKGVSCVQNDVCWGARGRGREREANRFIYREKSGYKEAREFPVYKVAWRDIK